MRYFYIDSCALVKRYHKEKGTDQVDVLFDTLIGRKPKCLITSIISIPETVATLNRKKNEGKIVTAQFKEILANLFDEVDMLDIITVDEERILGSIPLITKYNVQIAVFIMNIEDKRRLHERKFPNWEKLSDGGRKYWLEIEE